MKEQEILILKMKYAWAKIILEVLGIIVSDISRGVSIFGASGSSSHRVRSRSNSSSSEGSAHT